MEPEKRVDFDDYADTYEESLQQQLAFFSKDRDYFSAYKAELLASLLPTSPTRILDFGCGIGLGLPHLVRCFPGSEVFATDISPKSLEYVRKKYPNVQVVPDNELDGKQFDLIFFAGVLHHVPSVERAALARRVGRLLARNGNVCVFEHNPLNPLTRYLVATCPFDKDAELLGLTTTRRWTETGVGLKPRRYGYCLFFPPSLRAFRIVERAIRWLPLGGQYFVLAQK